MQRIITKLKTLATKGWKSKTILLGYATFALGGLQEILGQFEVVIKPHVYAVIGGVLGGLIVVCRLLTKIPVEQK
jgi:hypothetical protein